jgi:alpha-tubulin suppressor-like RCC1 family protein
LTGTVNAGATTGIISGNVYDYHTVTNPNYYDYQVVKIDRIPANSSQSVTLRAKIDPRKAQPSEADRFSTSTVAKIEVRITDDSSATALNSTARTIEWLNAGIRIDTQAPTLIRADNQQVVRTGNVVLTGSVQDDSAVPNVQLEYRFDSGTTTAMGCGAAVTGQWRCAIAVPSTATTMSYRMRASDSYNQLSPWSAWYSAQVDRDKPTFQLDASSTSLLVAPYVGGQTIQISGLLSDTMSTADMMVCDEQQANCTIAPSSSQIRPTTTYTTTVATSMAIAAQPCATTDLESYTRYPITVTGVGTSRIGALTVNTSIAHGAANEVDVWLESPSGTRVALLNSERGAGVNIRATFADTAVASSTTLTGTTALGATYKLVKPDGSLANFGGQPGNGTWTLLACDRTSNGTNGNILGAELVMTSATSAQSVSAPWTYTLANTANQDNVTRRIQFWAKDAAGNVSNAQNTTVRIDTVAPGMTVFQNAVTVLPSTASVPFQGTISDGGQIQSLTANVYAGTSQVATIALTPIEATSNEVKRFNYLLNRALRTYTWNMPLDTTTYNPGTYQVQFVVRDAVGNRRTSDAYTINVPVKTLPGIRDIQVTGSLNANEQTIRYKLDTGYSVTAVDAQIVLDSSVTTPYTGTVVQGWKDDGTSDTVLQTAIPAAIQTKQITKLDMNNDFAAALDRDGVLYTWPIDTDPHHQLTSNEIAGVTPIRDIVQFSIAEQYAWDNYLLTLDRAGRVTEYNRHVDDPHVVKTVVLDTTYQKGKIIGIDAGYRHNVALLSTGKVISWWHDVCEDLDDPDNDPPAYCDPSSPNYPITIPTKAQYGVAQVQAGVDFSVALRNDGTVVAWGSPINNHLAIPSTIKTVTQIAVGAEHVVALQEDGTVVAWGENYAGQTIVPEGLSDVIFVAAGGASSAAVTRSGKVVAWGETDFVKQGGASAVALNYSYCTPADECGTDWVQTGQSPTASSILTGSNVDYATDNNSATSFISTLETNPWWQYPLGATSVPVNQIFISSPRIWLSQNTKLHVMVSDNPDTTFSSADWKWHYVTDTVAVNMLLDLPPGITGKYVRLQLEGANESLSLSGIEIYQTNGNFDVPAQVITVNQTATQTKSQQVNAAVSFNTGTAVFTGVIPGRRYRYTLTATNTQGTQTYTGTFTSNQTFNRLYTPLLSNSSPAAPPASSGR